MKKPIPPEERCRQIDEDAARVAHDARSLGYQQEVEEAQRQRKLAAYRQHQCDMYPKLLDVLKALLENYAHNHGKGLGVSPVYRANCTIKEAESVPDPSKEGV